MGDAYDPSVAQPIPEHDPSKPDVWRAVIQFSEGASLPEEIVQAMRDRRQVGLDRYGTVLQPHNGRDSWRDLADELLDASAYSAQRVMESLPDDAGPGEILHALMVWPRGKVYRKVISALIEHWRSR